MLWLLWLLSLWQFVAENDTEKSQLLWKLRLHYHLAALEIFQGSLSVIFSVVFSDMMRTIQKKDFLITIANLIGL